MVFLWFSYGFPMVWATPFKRFNPLTQPRTVRDLLHQGDQWRNHQAASPISATGHWRQLEAQGLPRAGAQGDQPGKSRGVRNGKKKPLDVARHDQRWKTGFNDESYKRIAASNWLVEIILLHKLLNWPWLALSTIVQGGKGRQRP